MHLAWTVGEDRAADIRFASSADHGRSFSPPQVAFASDGHADAPKLAVDGSGSVHLVYAESPAGPFTRSHIRYSRRPAGAPVWPAPRQISGPAGGRSADIGFPALSLDRRGRIYVLWERYPPQGRRSQGLGLSHSGDGGASFAAPSVVPGSDDPAHGVNGSQQGLLMRKLAVSPAGAVAVVNSTFKPSEASRIWLFRGRLAE